MTFAPLGLLFKTVMGSFIGRCVAAALLGLVAIQGYGWVKFNQGSKTAATTINKQSEKLTTEAVQARGPASEPGSPDRLRKSSCRDCK
jgi:hypothetical protein